MTASVASLTAVVEQALDHEREAGERALAAATARHFVDRLLEQLVLAARDGGQDWMTVEVALDLAAQGATHVEDFGQDAELVYDSTESSPRLRRATQAEIADFQRRA